LACKLLLLPFRVFAVIAASVAGAAALPAAFSFHQPAVVPAAGGPAPASAKPPAVQLPWEKSMLRVHIENIGEMAVIECEGSSAAMGLTTTTFVLFWLRPDFGNFATIPTPT
jgi:hypothetical protein